ncbi:MAG: Coq4 family protein [Bacteroidota bacterium]
MPAEITYSKDKRQFLYALKNFFKWLRNPVNLDGPKYIFRVIYSVFGPEIHKVAKKVRANPKSRAMLDERADLGLIMADMDRMAELPEGSFGKVFYSFMSGDDILPGYVIAGQAYGDGHFDRLEDWEEDAKYLIERAGNTHDSTHILSGYGTDFCGELLNLPFSLGGCGMSVGLAKFLGGVIGVLTIPIIMPSIGMKNWIALNIDSGARGAEMAKQNSIIEVHFEAILEKSVPEVRRELNIPPHKHQKYVNEDGWMVSASWLRGYIGKRAADGFGTYAGDSKVRAENIVTLVKSGLPIRTVMSSSKEEIQKEVDRLASQSTPLADR